MAIDMRDNCPLWTLSKRVHVSHLARVKTMMPGCSVSGQRVGTLHTKDGAVLWRSRSLHLGPNEAVERITHETNEGPIEEVWQNYFTGGYDSLAGATRKVGTEPADEYLFIRDHLGSVALSLKLTVYPGSGADPENPKVATELGHEAELAMREGLVVAFAENGEIVVGAEAGIAAADGSSEAAIRTAAGDSLTLSADGARVSVKLPGGGEITSDEAGALVFAEDAEGRVSVESIDGGALSMDSLVQQRPVGTSWSATLSAVEEYEYTPYGVPTVRSNEGGQSVLRVWDETHGGTGVPPVWSNPREGRAAGAYLCASDSPTGATDAFARVTGSAAQSSIGLRFLYTGRPWSPVGEIYYYRARWYAPECGRFISRDPIGYTAGPTQYGYVRGNPIMMIDPTGLKDVYIIVNEDDDEADDQCEAIQDKIDPDADIYRVKTPEEFDKTVRHINKDKEPIDSLYIVSHGGPGMLSTESTPELNDTFDYVVLAGNGPIGPGSISRETSVWFYSCNMAQDDKSNNADDWTRTVGPGWSKYFNGARVYGNTGKVSAETGWPSWGKGLGAGKGDWRAWP